MIRLAKSELLILQSQKIKILRSQFLNSSHNFMIENNITHQFPLPEFSVSFWHYRIIVPKLHLPEAVVNKDNCIVFRRTISGSLSSSFAFKRTLRPITMKHLPKNYLRLHIFCHECAHIFGSYRS